MSTIANLMVKIGADTKDFTNAMSKAQGASKALLAGVGIAAVGIAAIGIKSIKAAGELEATTVAFNTMLGSAEKSKTLLVDLQKFAATTPFEFTEITTASKKLLAFGIGAEDITDTLRKLGDISSGIGAPIGEIAELYGKAKTQGRLFAEDINQLTGRGIPIIGELAAQFGITESEVKKLVESGAVGFSDLETAITSMTAKGSQFGGLMEAQSQTLPGMWSNLMDAMGQSSVVLGQELIKTFDLKEKLAGFIESLGEITALLQSEGLMGALDKIFNEKTKLMIVMISGAIFAALIPAIYGFVLAIGAAVIALAPFLLAGAAVAALAYGIYLAWEPIKAFFADTWESITSGFKSAFTSMSNFTKGIADSISGFFKGMVNGVINALNFMIGALNKLKFSTPSWVPGIGGKSFGFNISKIPSYAVGTPYVPKDGLAMLHKGERVVTASQNKNGSGVVINITGNTISSDMDINAIGEKLVDHLRRKGVVAV